MDDFNMNLHFISLGCPKNLVDSEVMLGQLIGDGYALVEDPKKADIIIVNTCAFIEDAKMEAIDTILEMSEHKKKGRCRLLVVAGCLSQRYKSDLAQLLPEVDIFVGTGEFDKITGLIRDWQGEQKVEVGKPKYMYDHATPRLHTSSRHVAYLKIAEGCFHPCSFCVIPKLRGAFRSRPPDSIVREAEGMLGRGVREINLIAQDTTAYGRDIGTDLQTLLGELAGLNGPKWLRLLYTYPHDFPDGVIDAMRDYDDVCAYVDLPVQHISDRILKKMKRKGEGKEIRKLIDRFRDEVPNMCIRTTLIVGFPGETEEDFDELLDFVSEFRFEHLGVFTYSPEEGTPAAKLQNKVRHEIAEARRAEVMDLQREISLANNFRFIGKRIHVLVEGASSETDMLLQGRHEGQAPEFDGVVYISDGIAAAGDFAIVEVTDAHEYDLVGRIVG